MKVILTGASGMVGQGVLRECLLDPGVTEVLSVGRTPLGQSHPKLRELIRPDLFDLDEVEDQLQGYDACFFCLGVTSAGMSEDDYRHLSYDLTLSFAERIANRDTVFIYVSGTGTDRTGTSKTMWARVKGETENALLQLPFQASYMFRPGVIQPLHGIRSKTKVYQLTYSLGKPVLPLLRKLFPSHILTTEEVGRAMIRAARDGFPRPVLEPPDIHHVQL